MGASLAAARLCTGLSERRLGATLADLRRTSTATKPPAGTATAGVLPAEAARLTSKVRAIFLPPSVSWKGKTGKGGADFTKGRFAGGFGGGGGTGG